MERRFDHAAIEKKWRERHDQEKLYEADVAQAKDSYYVLDMFPYPSSEAGLHVGHWRGYVLSDFYARHAMLQGKTVLHPMGFDSFGLPAENAAIKHKSQPKKFTDQAIKAIRTQLEQMGSAFDWSKYLSTSDPNYYKWTQWLFLQFFKHGLAEKRLSLVNWCPNDQTVLANEQVVNGNCERCGSQVTKKELSQWFIKATDFAQELLDDLEQVQWPERVKSLQRDWIGRSEGTSVIFESPAGPIEVFTTRVDTIFGVTALVLAPEHPLVEALTAKEEKSAVSQYLKEIMAKTDVMRQQNWDKDKSAAFTGKCATHPLTGKDIPIWIADYVLMSYGTGAVMSVPAHDERDNQFAKAHSLPIELVIEPITGTPQADEEFRRSIVAVVENSKTGKVLSINWGDKLGGNLFIGGGVEENEDLIEAAKREIIEETGYTDLKFVEQTEIIHHHYTAHSKGVNRNIEAVGLKFELTSDAQTSQKLEANEKDKFTVEWLTQSEASGRVTDPLHHYVFRKLIQGEIYSGTGVLTNSEQFSGLTSAEAMAKITAELAKKGRGQKKTIYRLRDWLVSRQRYWGPPIPIVYDPEGQPHAVKDEHLPLLLPEDVDFLPGGESPIKRSQEFVTRAEKLYGPGWRFETDTLDTFVDSSWYFLRYLSPTDDTQAFDPALVKKWLPVDLYVGGIEHATLHLLYARLVVKFLSTYGYIDRSITEPFKELFSIGTITMHGAKMSKSKGNVVSPDLLVEHFGTDALRGYELFIGPLDVEADWTNRGINGVHRFLIKLYQLSGSKVEDAKNEAATEQFNSYLQKIEPMIAQYRLNTLIAEAMKFTTHTLSKGVPKEVWEKFIITLSPIFPYLCEEIWETLGQKESIFKARWPKAERTTAELSLKVLINQKFVATVLVKSTKLTEAEAVELVSSDPAVSNRLEGKKIKTVVYRPNLLLNFVVTT